MSSPPLPDNALLLWLQDESNNECATSEAITQMYSIFDDDENEPIEHFQQDDRHHCFLIFEAAPVPSFPIFSLPDPTLIRPTGLILHTTYLILAETERGWFAMK